MKALLRCSSFSAILLVTFLAVDLPAQTTSSGGLTGVITDQSNAVVPNADVELRDKTKGSRQSTRTDRLGVYRFFFVPPGKYVLTVSNGGFRNESRIVDVLLGPPGTVNVTLSIATASSEITVTGEAPLIQGENGDFSATMNQKLISEVPNPGNDLTYIAQTGPGVVMNTDVQGAGNFSILGMPATSNLFTINGMNDTDNYLKLNLVGPLGLLLGQNQIQEATVVEIGYSGQFGGAAGGSINYLTKSGGNGFHGNAQFYWNGRILNANDWFNNAYGNPRPSENADQWAASLGGPIKKNKLFFFFDTEGLRLTSPQSLYASIPSPQFQAATIASIDSDPRFGPASATDAFYRKIFALYNAAPGAASALPGGFGDPLGCAGFSDPKTGLGLTVPCAMHFTRSVSLKSQDAVTSGRVDWNLSNSDRAFVFVRYDIGNQPWSGVDPISPLFDVSDNLHWWQGQLIETHTFGPSAASQFLIGGRYYAPIFQLEHPAQAIAAFPTSLSFAATGAFTDLAPYNGGYASPQSTPTTDFQVSEDLVKTWRNHKLAFGANFERTYWSNFSYTWDALGTLWPETLDAFFHGGVDPNSPSTDYTFFGQTFASRTSERIKFYSLAIYGQDEWRVRPNLALTFTLRAEHYSNPVCDQNCFARMAGDFSSANHDPAQPYNQAILINQRQAFPAIDNIDWSPRISFAWQPNGPSHNTVIRGGIGIFYDPMPGWLATNLSSNPPLLNQFFVVGDNIAPNETTSVFKDAAASNAALLQGFSSGQTLSQIQAAITGLNGVGYSPPALTVPASKIHLPQYQRWSLEVQQAIGTSSTVSLTYTGNHGIHELTTNASANAFGFGSLPSSLCSSPPLTPCADPRFSKVTSVGSDAVSNYNAMIASFRHRFTQANLQFQANYTYSHAFDEISNGGLVLFSGSSAVSAQNPNFIRGSYGSADYDVRHSLNAGYVWELPLKAALRHHGSDRVVQGWQLSGTLFARTGFPYSVYDYAESFSLATNNYWGYIYAVPVGPLPQGGPCSKGAALPSGLSPCLPPQLSSDGVTPNPNALFIQSTCETGFNSGYLPGPAGPCSGLLVTNAQPRNHFRGPSYFNTDLSIMKNTKLHSPDGATLGIGFQFFNLFNHPNFGLPDHVISDSTFGRIQYLEQTPTSLVGGAGMGGDAAPRMIQLKVQMQF